MAGFLSGNVLELLAATNQPKTEVSSMKRMEATHEQFKAMYLCMKMHSAISDMERDHYKSQIDLNDFITALHALEKVLDRRSWSEYYRITEEAKKRRELEERAATSGAVLK